MRATIECHIHKNINLRHLQEPSDLRIAKHHEAHHFWLIVRIRQCHTKPEKGPRSVGHLRIFESVLNCTHRIPHA